MFLIIERLEFKYEWFGRWYRYIKCQISSHQFFFNKKKIMGTMTQELMTHNLQLFGLCKV